jgi:glucokinase
VCGGSGCLEQYASGRGLVERAQELACSDITTWAGRPFDRIEAIHVVDAARAGVASAVGLIDDAARAVGQAVVALAVTTEPDRVYLGGTLAHRAADLLLPRIRSELETRWPLRDVVPIVPVVLDDVGPYAAAVGAALLAGDRSDT